MNRFDGAVWFSRRFRAGAITIPVVAVVASVAVIPVWTAAITDRSISRGVTGARAGEKPHQK